MHIICVFLYLYLPLLFFKNKQITKKKIMSEVAHDNWTKLKLFTCFINYYLIEETAALNVSTGPLYGCDNGSSQISYKGTQFLSLLSLTRRGIERRGTYIPWLSQRWLTSALFSNIYIFVCKFIYHSKSSIFTTVFKTASSSVVTCH